MTVIFIVVDITIVVIKFLIKYKVKTSKIFGIQLDKVNDNNQVDTTQI